MSYHECPIEPDDWTEPPEPLEEECQVCKGSGINSTTHEICPNCNGYGSDTDEDYD